MLNKKQGLIIALGGIAVLLVAVAAATFISKSSKQKTPYGQLPPPGLQLDISEAPAIDAKRQQLRCFVNGQFVGMATLDDCATKNGVAAQALDVGLDESGELVAAETASLAPPPPVAPSVVEPKIEPVQTEMVTTESPSVASGACLRFASGEWREVAIGVSLAVCAQVLYDNRCERPGGASYGRWADTTLRLVPGRVEQSVDNKVFTTLVEQSKGCQVPLAR